ncbi:Crp/Fnr family transcriptional regulator [Actinocorallia aurantiaca]|jgi:CRP/FNR family cyclic AMP-dependent transcriptional regulator|uniref:Crp/Fnr family transcriptional regulator n=1 Tax=Actinocorallia aurantiaca TaxID=46204 RepID=A0ABP6GYH8_9ACTN
MTPASKVNRETFWSSLDPAARDTLARGGRNRRYRKGDHLCLQGEPPDQVLILQKGWAKICVGDSEGRERVIAVRGPGELIGETGLITESPRTATVTALHQLIALVVPRQRFRSFLNDHPDAWPKVYQTLSRRLAQSDERILSLGSHVGAGRLALFLLRLAEQSGLPEPDGGIGLPPLSQTELGSCVDVSRETVARAMRDWREQGFIRSGWRQTVLLDPEGLRKHARKFMI